MFQMKILKHIRRQKYGQIILTEYLDTILSN